MSLILEALKKLDRERQLPERGFLVVAHAPWPARGPGRRALGFVLVALGLAAGGLAVGLLRGKDARPAPPTPLKAAEAKPPAPAAAPNPAIPRATPEPARPAAPEAPPAARSFVLQAISQRDGAPVAVLNDRLVREGDSFDGVKILRIGATDVEIEADGVRRVVSF